MPSLSPHDERASALTLLDTALERLRTGQRAEAHDLFLAVADVTDGAIETFATWAASALEEATFPNDTPIERGFAALKASLDGDAPPETLPR